jgi:hypothetical protein
VCRVRKGVWTIMSEKISRLREKQSDFAHIDALMHELRQESPQQAPLRVRHHMEQAVRKYRFSQGSRRNRWLLAAAVLLAAVTLTIGTIISKRSGDRGNSTAKVMAHGNPQPPPVLETQPLTPKVPTRDKARRHQQPKGAVPQPVFVRLPFSDPTLMTGTSVTIRLALSDAELLAMGVRPIESDPSRSYVADLVLGDDGLPRAIRIVSHGPRIPGGS